MSSGSEYWFFVGGLAVRRRGRGRCRGRGRHAAEAEVGQGGAAGKEPPKVDEEQSHAGNHGFLLAHGAAVAADDVAPFGKAVPAGLPAQEAPNGFGEQAAQAPVALPVG